MRALMRPAAATLLATGFLFVPAGNAQVQSPAPGLSDPSPNIPDQKPDAAAAAIERMASLKQDYQQRIAAAAAADKERILNEAVNALAKAVTDQGLSVEARSWKLRRTILSFAKKFVSASVLRPNSRSSEQSLRMAGISARMIHPRLGVDHTEIDDADQKAR
jgi:hypothetical protein